MLTRWLAALLLAASGATVPALTQARGGSVTVRLLAINDLHGVVDPPTGNNGRLGSTPVGGLAYLATHLKQLERDVAHSIVVSAGDNIGASPLLSALFHDEPTIEALNTLGLSLSAVGNHELDEGWPELLRLQRGGCHPHDGCQDGTPFAGASFHFLAANVHRVPATAAARRGGAAATRDTLFPASDVREFDGVKVGFIGATLHTAPNMLAPDALLGLQFEDEVQATNRAVEALRRQGVHAVVLLIHQGADGDGTDNSACGNLSVEMRDILKRLSPEVDVVVSGHTHRSYDCTLGRTLLTSTDAYGRRITRIDLTIDRQSGDIVAHAAENIPVTRDVEPDAAVTAVLDRYRPLVATESRRPVGAITAPIVEAANDAGESPLGDAVADGMLDATREAHAGGAVVAFMNPGGIRTDLVSSAEDGVPAGVVSYGDVFKVLPFGNQVLVKSITGEVLVRLLEAQFDNPAPGEQRILQVSQGFTYRYSRARQAGQRVDRASVRVNGQLVQPTARYRVAMPDFLWTGGDRFTVARESINVTPGLADVEVFARYVKAHSPLAPPTPDRIHREDAR